MQRSVLAKLASVVADSCYLAGGVAVAAHLGHRRSRDLDLFSIADPTALLQQLERVPGVTIDGRAPGTLHLRVDGIPVSLIEYRYPMLTSPSPVAELSVNVAAIEDLACMKLSAIAGRGAARDFWDLHAMICATGTSLAEVLIAFGRKYPVEDQGHVVRSLAYFGDADAAPLPDGLEVAAWQRIRADVEGWVRALVAAPPI